MQAAQSITSIDVGMASWEDLHRIKELALLRAVESDFQEYAPINDYQVEKYIVYAWKTAPCFTIRNNDGIIIAFAGLVIDSKWWSNSPYLTDYMVYCMPQYRSNHIVKALYGAAQNFADRIGVPLMLSYIATDRIEARCRQMRGLGFKQTGALFTYGGLANG